MTREEYIKKLEAILGGMVTEWNKGALTPEQSEELDALTKEYFGKTRTEAFAEADEYVAFAEKETGRTFKSLSENPLPGSEVDALRAKYKQVTGKEPPTIWSAKIFKP